jgi:protein-disulfide isomerase
MTRTIRFVLSTSLFIALAGGCARAPEDTGEAAQAEKVAGQQKGAPPARPAQAAKAALPAQTGQHAQPAEAKAEDGDCGNGNCKEGCHGQEQAKTADDDKVFDVATGVAPARGPARAEVTIVVFSDYQCPFCKRSEATIRAIQDEYQGRVRYAFRNNPLPMHDNARPAAKAAMAAAEQGKFWEYHDALFQHQDALDRASLDKYAEELGLDVRRFDEAMASDRIEKQVAADEADAHKLGATGTPQFFVNGKRLIGAQPVNVSRTAVDAALGRR